MAYQQQDYSNLRKIVTGDIIVKCRYHNDIRRIPINQAPSYDELCLMMYRLFKNNLSSPENIVLKYTDDEGDLISMTDDTDVNHAISQSSLLKITIFDKQNHPFMGTADQTAPAYEELKDQMSQLRDMIDHVLGSLSYTSKGKTDRGTNGNGVQGGVETVEKSYRHLSTAELAHFLGDERKDQKKTEMQEPSPHQAPSYPPPPPPVTTTTTSTTSSVPMSAAQSSQQQQVHTPYPPPPSSSAPTVTPSMPRPPIQQQQQPTSSMQSGYPPAQQSPITSAPPPSYPAPPRPPVSIPQPGTPQTPTNYPPERPPPTTNNYNNYGVSTPSAPHSTQYYYPAPPQQQQQQQPPPPSQGQRPPMNTAGWR
ncbi:PB1 domain-containing protein [Phascolomyces articulosus]|uniref:PB1 domain-containing protein n=1 Tax=Phascolomyces articulosus TaxID=60185 RepID=A0AAD5K3A4_9FUNG|nr:PB1 domain-containing protein [Phascolomyces articulosus]